MIPLELYKELRLIGIDFFTGVPDSVCKAFSLLLEKKTSEDIIHVPTVNEGSAIALCSGYHMSTGKVGLVYMQNSGLWNALNPLLTLADKSVFGIPIILLIGLRGNDKGFIDEEHHVKQGKVTVKTLEMLEIPYLYLSHDFTKTKEIIRTMFFKAKEKRGPVALLVKKDFFLQKVQQIDKSFCENSEIDKKLEERFNTWDAIETIISILDERFITVSSTGEIARTTAEARKQKGKDDSLDILVTGAMGHASQVALGIAYGLKGKGIKTCCIEGDGSALMHMGSIPVIGQACLPFLHIVLNNRGYASTGRQSSCAPETSFFETAKAARYNSIFKVSTKNSLKTVLEEVVPELKSPCFIECMVDFSEKFPPRPIETSLTRIKKFQEKIRPIGILNSMI